LAKTDRRKSRITVVKPEDVIVEEQILFDAPEHTAMLSFNCDIQCEYFKTWWEKRGRELFIKFYNGTED
jgi:hypothetical protein